MASVSFIRIDQGGLCAPVTGVPKSYQNDKNVNFSNTNNESSINSDIGELDEQELTWIVDFVNGEQFKMTNIIHHRFYSPSDSRNLALFQCTQMCTSTNNVCTQLNGNSGNILKHESNILRGFKFPFPLSLHIFFGPIVLAFQCIETGMLESLSINDWATIVNGWQDMALIKCGTQDDALRPFWTSDSIITEGTMTDIEDEIMEDNIAVHELDDNSSDCTSDENIDISDNEDLGDIEGIDGIDDVEELEGHGSDPEITAYYHKTLGNGNDSD